LICIQIAIQIAMKLTFYVFDNKPFSLFSNIFYYFLIFLITYLLTTFSFRYIESPILKIKNNFNFIGIEKEKEYFDIAKARIEHAKGSGLFKPE